MGAFYVHTVTFVQYTYSQAVLCKYYQLPTTIPELYQMYPVQYILMKIIGHRGAAGLALENTLESIHAARKAGVDGIEFDIRLTADNQLILNHDSHTGRTATTKSKIKHSRLHKLKTILLRNDQRIPTVMQALRECKDTPAVIEPKGNDWAEPLSEILKPFINQRQTKVIAFNHSELGKFANLCPKVATYALHRTSALDALNAARQYGLDGIDINFWLLNPLTYWLARWHKLDIIVYTVNSPFLARFIAILYPAVALTSDRPDRLQSLRNQ